MFGYLLRGNHGWQPLRFCKILSLFLGRKLQRNLINEQNNNKKENLTWKSLLDPSPVRQSPDFYGVIKADRARIRQSCVQLITESCQVSFSQTLVLKASLIHCSEDNVKIYPGYTVLLRLLEFFY